MDIVLNLLVLVLFLASKIVLPAVFLSTPSVWLCRYGKIPPPLFRFAAVFMLAVLTGVLILSEFAGAASQMWLDGLPVNPFDRESVADAVCRAFKIEAGEGRRRMMRLRRIVSRNDIFG